jgi:cellulose synthase/poly-beta-1,6-N-acetylglucosamine synthase-like glycosyltransferase
LSLGADEVKHKRIGGLVLLLVAAFGFALFWWTLAADEGLQGIDPSRGDLFNVLPILYSWSTPPLSALVAAVVVAFAVAFAFIALEARDLNHSRRSVDGAHKPLSPRVLMAETAGIFQGEVSVVILIPAHNEAEVLAGTLDALSTQTHRADRVIVVADNCTDATIAIASDWGAEVVETAGNTAKKAGALNQVLDTLLPELGTNDTVMVLDADSRIHPEFLATAVRRFSADRGLSAVGGQFTGEPGSGIIGQLQRNEYTRYQREIRRRREKVFVLTGTATIFRAKALQCVADSRGSLIPGAAGSVYDVAALTEDNELTIALKSLGALMISPAPCRVETEVMPTVRMLWRQRLRWQRGAVENITHYGITPATTRYWSQQLGIAYSVFALGSFFLLIFLQVTSTDLWVWYPFWITILFIFMAERVVTVWTGGWRARALALLVVPELLFDAFQDVVFLKGIFDITTRRTAKWGHEGSHRPRSVAS